LIYWQLIFQTLKVNDQHGEGLTGVIMEAAGNALPLLLLDGNRSFRKQAELLVALLQLADKRAYCQR
jgi:hypothetical protein